MTKKFKSQHSPIFPVLCTMSLRLVIQLHTESATASTLRHLTDETPYLVLAVSKQIRTYQSS